METALALIQLWDSLNGIEGDLKGPEGLALSIKFYFEELNGDCDGLYNAILLKSKGDLGIAKQILKYLIEAVGNSLEGRRLMAPQLILIVCSTLLLIQLMLVLLSLIVIIFIKPAKATYAKKKT